MKKTVFLFLLIIYIVCGCQRDDVSSALKRAERMIADNPRGAVAFLNHLQDSVKGMSQEDEMLCNLLLIRATDKADMPLKDIDGIKNIVAYYENNDDDVGRLAMAYYYAGRTLVVNQDALAALNYFLKAEDCLENGKDDRLYTVLCSQIANIYSHRYMFDDARSYLHKAYVIDSIARDTFSMVSDLRDIAVAYSWEGDEKESQRLLRLAHTMAQKANSLFLTVQVEKDLAYSFKNQQEYDSALYYIRRPSQQPDLVDKGQVVNLLATLYQSKHQMDSASHYARMLQDMPSVDPRNTAHKILAEDALVRGDVQNALTHLRRHYELEDSTDLLENAEAIARAKEFHAHQRHEQENNALILKNKRWKITVLSVVSLLVLLLSAFAVWVINRRRIHLLMQLRYEHMQQLYLHNKETYERQLLDSKQKITDLEQQLEQSAAKKELEQLETHEQSVKNTEIYAAFHELLRMGKTPTHGQWQELETVLNRHFNDFIPRLEHVRKLSETEKRVCLLLKIGMRPSDIATVLCKEPNTVSSIRTRLCHKFCLDRFTSSDWDTFIKGM